jgi:hypothetical protein
VWPAPLLQRGDEERKRCRCYEMRDGKVHSPLPRRREQRALHYGRDDNGRRGLGKRRCELGPRLGEGARDHHGDVILLFAGAELPDCSNDCLEQPAYRKVTIGAKGVD